jgi:hypothetical protein
MPQTYWIPLCPRCGKCHANIEPRRMLRPLSYQNSRDEEVLLTHWAECPDLGDPILFEDLALFGEPK